MNTSFYKFGLSEPGSTSYYDVVNAYEVNDHDPISDEYRRPLENSPTMTDDQTAAANSEWAGNNTNNLDNPVECKWYFFFFFPLVMIYSKIKM